MSQKSAFVQYLKTYLLGSIPLGAALCHNSVIEALVLKSQRRIVRAFSAWHLFFHKVFGG